MAVVYDDYRTRFSVEGAEKALREMQRTGAGVQEALKKATDPAATKQNLDELKTQLDKNERALAEFRGALGDTPLRLRGLDTAARSAAGGLSSLASTVPGLSALSGVLLGSAGVVAGITALGAAALSAVPGTVDKVGELGRTAERLGLGVEGLQEFRGALLLMGEPVEGLEDALSTLNERIGQAVLGIPEGVSVFKDLGIAFKNSDGTARSLNDILPEIADRLKGMGSEAEQTAFLTELLGDRGKSLARLLRDGSAAFREHTEAARAAGLVLGEDLVKEAQAADAALKLAGERMDKAIDKIVIGLAPPVVYLTEKFADLVTWIGRSNEELDKFNNVNRYAEVGVDERRKRLAAANPGLRPDQIAAMEEAMRARLVESGAADVAGEELAMLQLAQMPRGPALVFSSTSPETLPPKTPPPKTPPPKTPPRRSGSSVSSPVSEAALGQSGSTAQLAAWRRELAAVGKTGEESARATEAAWTGTISAVESGLNLLSSTGDNAFGKVAGGMVESLRHGRDLVQTILGVASALQQVAAVGGGLAQSAGGGLASLFASLGAPGAAAGLEAFFGLSTGNFGGAAALAAGVPAAQSLGVLGFAQGADFTVPGAGPPDSVFFPMYLSPGEHVKITPGEEYRQGAGRAGPVSVTVNNYAGAAVQTRERRRPDGGLDLELVIGQLQEQMAGDLARRRGPLSDALRAGFVERSG